jgi:hypothetical protein
MSKNKKYPIRLRIYKDDKYIKDIIRHQCIVERKNQTYIRWAGGYKRVELVDGEYVGECRSKTVASMTFTQLLEKLNGKIQRKQV